MANIYGLNNTKFPDAIQEFQTKQDLTNVDASDYQTYIQCLKNKDSSGAKAALRRIQNWANKSLSALEINTITDTLVALQKFYAESGQQPIQEFLQRFSYKGDWNGSITYTRLNLVTHDNILYICAVSSTRGIQPNPETQLVWHKVTPTNPYGKKTTWCGNWNMDKTYNKGDLVSSYDNCWYQAISDNLSGLPPQMDEDNWVKIADFNTFQPVVSAEEPVGQANKGLWFRII